MPVPIAEILTPIPDNPEWVERIAHRTITPPITIVPYNPEWPSRFLEVKSRIQTALDPSLVLEIAHTGSTSVPNLPAKDIIDVDLILKDVTDEASYVQAVEEKAGFRFLLREPRWHQHRFFVESSNKGYHYHVNLHVWGPDSPEAARHRIFRDWLRKTPADVELYAKAKRQAAEQTAATAGEGVMDYTARKEATIREILERAFRDLGYIQ